MCRACSDGTCTRYVAARGNGVLMAPASVELTPLKQLFCVGMVSLGFVAVLKLIEEVR